MINSTCFRANVVIFVILLLSLFFIDFNYAQKSLNTRTKEVSQTSFEKNIIASKTTKDEFLFKLAKSVTNSKMAKLMAGGIFFLALILYIFFWGFTRKLVEIEKDVIKKINTTEVFDQNLFTEIFKKKEVLLESWKSFFQSSCKYVDVEKRYKRLRSSEEFFDSELIISRIINIDLWRSWPNFLTGLGIFFTFIGLTGGIYLASKGLTSNENEEIKNALTNLLNGASLAFYTSIAGLFSSILFSVFKKIRIHKIKNRIVEMCHIIDFLIPEYSIEKMNFDMLSQNIEQTTQLKSFNTDIAASIASEIDNRFKEGDLGKAIYDLVDAVKGMRSDRLNENQSAIEGLLAKFQDNLTGNAGSQIETMATTIEKVSIILESVADKLEVQQNESIKKTKEANDNIVEALNFTADKIDKLIENSMTGFANGITGASAEASANIENSSRNMEKVLIKVLEKIELMFINSSQNFEKHQNSILEKMEKSVNLLVVKMNSAGDSFNVTLDKTKDVVEDLKGFSSAMQLLLDGFNKVGAITQNVTSNLGVSADIFEKSANSMSNFNNSSKQSLQIINEHIVTIKNINQELKINWEKYADRFDESEEAAKNIFNEIQNGLIKYKEQIKDFNKEMDQSFSRAINSLSGVIGDLSEVVDEFENKTQ